MISGATIFRPRHFLFAVVCVVIYCQFVQSWQAVTPFDGANADGPFQLYNALRRIDAGQLPGRDFPAFHGLGVPLLHYVPYRMFGGGLIASELARQLASRLLPLGIYLLFSWLFTRSLWMGVACAVLQLGVDGPPLFEPLFGKLNFDSDHPGNSLTGLRSLAPLVFIGLAYRCDSGWRDTIGLALILAITWMLGVEQSFALAGSVAVTAGAIYFVSLRPTPLPSLGRTIAIGILFVIAITAMIAGDQLLEVHRYFLIRIPNDQAWYFGSPPNNFLGDGSPISASYSRKIAFFTAIFTVLWIWSLWMLRTSPNVDDRKAALASAIGAGYSILSLFSLLGYLAGSYLSVSKRVGLLLFATWIIRSIGRSKRAMDFCRRLAGAATFQLMCWGYLAIWIILLATKFTPLEATKLSDPWESVAHNFASDIRTHIPNPKTGDLWSTYAGIVEARLDILHPDTDYVIHALDDLRPKYINRFAEVRPQFVQTMKREAFVYEAWIQNSTWGFYERVLENYEIVNESDSSLLWMKTDQVWLEPPSGTSQDWQKIAIDPQLDAVSVTTPPSDANIAVVRVEYDVADPLKRIPLIGKQSRLLVSAEGLDESYAVSLPPRQTTWEFPLLLRSGAPFSLVFRIEGLTLATVKVKSIAIRYLSVKTRNHAFLGMLPQQTRGAISDQ